MMMMMMMMVVVVMMMARGGGDADRGRSAAKPTRNLTNDGDSDGGEGAGCEPSADHRRDAEYG